MRRAVLSAVLLAAALTVQLTVVNRLPLPGAGAPDLVLLTVVALGFCSRPATAAVIGFCAGLCLDIAPPGSYLIGEYALVFCLVGYLCGRIRGVLDTSAMLAIAGAMAAAAAGEALVALLGLAVSDPQVSWTAVQQVLPSSIVYDVTASPFVLYLVMRAVRWADSLGRAGAAGGQPADGSSLLARSLGAGGALSGSALPGATVLGGAGLLGGAGWLAGPVGSRGSGGPRPPRGRGKPHSPRTPRLREAAARSGDGWVGGGPRPGLAASAGLRTGRPPLARRPDGRPGCGRGPGPQAPRWPGRRGRSRARRPTCGSAPAAAVTAASVARSAAVRRGQGGSALRGRRGSGPPGSAFRGRRPAPGRQAAARTGAAGRAGSYGGPRFRPETRLPGGSSNDAALRSAALHRALPGRRVNLRLGTGRRHDGVVGGGALRRGALAGRAHRGSQRGRSASGWVPAGVATAPWAASPAAAQPGRVRGARRRGSGQVRPWAGTPCSGRGSGCGRGSGPGSARAGRRSWRPGPAAGWAAGRPSGGSAASGQEGFDDPARHGGASPYCIWWWRRC